MPLMEKKYSAKDVDKVSDELEDMKQTVLTIHMKCLDQFEVKYSRFKGWFKLDSGFKNRFQGSFRIL